MGTGDVPDVFPFRAANALWVVTGENTARATRSPHTAWPAANSYTPHQVVYARWSFEPPNRTLSAASVTMWDAAGNNVPLTVDHRPANTSEPLVWVPEIESSTYRRSRSAPASDEWYRVRISGVTGGTSPTIEYTVVIFDPSKALTEAEATRFNIRNSGAAVNLEWFTPDQTAWRIMESTDLKNWTASTSAQSYDGFRVQMTIPKGAARKYFRLEKTAQ